MSKIFVRNVLFGDCNIIKYDRRKILIVDCGSLNRSYPNGPSYNTTSELAYSKIRFLENTPQIEKQLLISHYDKDHYNGILNINPDNPIIFKRIYLPFTILKENAYEDILNNTRICQLALLFCAQYPRTTALSTSKLLTQLWEKIPYLTDDFHNIRCLKKGDSFNIGTQKHEVLWPPADRWIWSYSEDDNECPILQLEKENIKNSFYQYLNFFEHRWNDYKTFCDIIYIILSLLNTSETNDNRKEYFDYIQKLKEFSLKIKQRNVEEYNDRNTDKKRKKIILETARAIYHDYINKENNRSIVFHDQSLDPLGKYVFLGDIAPKVVRTIKFDPNYHFKCSYNAVKVNHHGTDDYYSQDMPNGLNYIITNGTVGNRTSWLVSENLIGNICEQTVNPSVYCTGEQQLHCNQMKQLNTFTTCSFIHNNVKFGDNVIDV